MANVRAIPFERIVEIEDHGEPVERHAFYGRTPEKAEARATSFVRRESARAPLFTIKAFWRVFQGVRMVDD